MEGKRRSGEGLSVLAAAVLLSVVAAPARGQTCNASNDPTIAIGQGSQLQFGQLIATASAGTAVIDPATNNRTVTGGVVAAGGVFNAGSFNVLLCGQAGPKRFDVLLPAGAVTITSGGGSTMTVDTFTRSPTGTISASTSTTTPFTVGATLHVAANQAQGVYAGNYTVTVVRQ